jgi:hypothetical protein
MVFGRIAGYLGFLLSYRRKVFLLRKKYDRIREKADRIRSAEKRLAVLKILDHIEPTLIMLEEHKISRFERGRMFNMVRDGVGQAKRELKEYRPYAYTRELRRPARRY